MREILEDGPSFRSGDLLPDWSRDLEVLEQALGVGVDSDYREFLVLGGLGELNFEQRVLSPAEISEARELVHLEFVPFASNGCGDYFAWRVGELPRSTVYFLDHEAPEPVPVARAFRDALSSWRRR